MIIDVISWASVYLYGLVLTAAFLDIPYNKNGLFFAALQSCFCIGIQHFIDFHFGYYAVEMAYPLICHLPILLMSVLVFKRSLISSGVALLAAYLLTIPRNLVGEVCAFVFAPPYAKELGKIIATLPLLLFFLVLLRPVMHRMLLFSERELWLFLFPATMYYVIIYATSVYTDVVHTGNFLVMSLLITMLCIGTFIYVLLNYKQLQKNSILREQQQMMEQQLSETGLRLEEIRYSQQKTRAMRHDLRHYLQILHDYAAEGNLDAVENYIHSISDIIEDTVVAEYCSNKSINLILSSYCGKAKHSGITFSISAALPKVLPYELDLCVILSNALENALHACEGRSGTTIDVICKQYADKTVISIQNPYFEAVDFTNALPVSHRKNHGIGTRSILLIAESHGGTADFSATDGIFTMRAVL